MRSICISIVATLVLAGTSFAATINVPEDEYTIQGAIDASSDGDVIAIAPGTYYEQLLLSSHVLTIQGTLNGDGSLATTIDAQQGGSVFFIDGETEGEDTIDVLVIKDLVITGGTGSGTWNNWTGGGIYCFNSNPTIINCTISGNTAGRGGGIYCSNGNATIIDCTISGNTAYGTYGKGGGIFCIHSHPTIIGCTISNNHATHRGGGIYKDDDPGSVKKGSPTIIECTISDNTATDSGGGINCGDGGGWVLVIDSLICGNEPDQIGGDAFFFWDYGGNTVAGWVDGCPPTGACCVPSGCDSFTEYEESCSLVGGTWLGEGASCDDCAPTCQGDANTDGMVDIFDLLSVIDGWGTCN